MDNRREIDGIAYGLLFTGVLLVAFYPFPSGGMQPSHLILLGFSLVVLATRGLPLLRWNTCLGVLLIYSVLLNGLHGMRDSEIEPMLHSAYLAYNFLLCTAIFAFLDAKAVRLLFGALVVAALITCCVTLVDGVNFVAGAGVRGRSTGLFNNPNQLGFFSVVIISFYYLFSVLQVGGVITRNILLISAFFLAVASLSKAALVANLAISLVIFFPRSDAGRQLRLMRLALWLSATFAACIAVFLLYVNKYLDGLSFVRRLQNMFNEDDSSLAERGYFALSDGGPLEVVFGLGHSRVAQIVGHEVHSTFGSILSVYGLVGLGIFITLMSVWFLRLRRAFGIVGLACLAGPSVLYGISHNGTRFVPFWILFAVTISLASKRRLSNNRSQVWPVVKTS